MRVWADDGRLIVMWPNDDYAIDAVRRKLIEGSLEGTPPAAGTVAGVRGIAAARLAPRGSQLLRVVGDVAEVDAERAQLAI
jgi:hypothetical protein